MANFVYNSYSGESSSSQWRRYLQERELFGDLKSAIKAQTQTYRNEFRKASETYRDESRKASEAITSAIDDSTRQQAQAITDAANIVGDQITELSGEISQLGTMLDWRLSGLVDQQRISNLLLENVALLLRIPDVQKERQYYIEQGFKHYKNAALDPEFYEDALENLLEAEKREKTDYVVLHRIGMIYLYYEKLADTTKAEGYLRRAAKYAAVESDPNALRVFNVLAGDASHRLSNQSTAPEAIKALTAESYFQAGVACYAQAKFSDALELSSKAFDLLPSLLEAGFMKAKSLAAAGNETEAANVLEGVINAERFYAVKTAADGDLATKPEVQTLLRYLRDEAVRQAKKRIAKCTAAMMPYCEAAPFILELEAFVQQNSYLAALATLDGLTCKRQWRAAIAQSIESFIFEEEKARFEWEKARQEAERQAQINHWMALAHAEYVKQTEWWVMRSDFRQAISLFDKAAQIGSKEAATWAHILRVRARML